MTVRPGLEFAFVPSRMPARVDVSKDVLDKAGEDMKSIVDGALAFSSFAYGVFAHFILHVDSHRAI